MEEQLSNILTECRKNIEVIIDNYVEAHKKDPSTETIEKFKKEIAHAVTSGVVHKGLGIADTITLTTESRKLNMEAGEEFRKRIFGK